MKLIRFENARFLLNREVHIHNAGMVALSFAVGVCVQAVKGGRNQPDPVR